MARVALTVTNLAPNSSTVRPAGVAGNTDGHSITGVQTEELFILATVATATTNLTIKAGDYPPAIAAGLGDLVLALPVGSHLIGPLESGRFQRGDGEVWINYATAANFSAVAPVRLPRTA
jgi:hypothetical protein